MAHCLDSSFLHQVLINLHRCLFVVVVGNNKMFCSHYDSVEQQKLMKQANHDDDSLPLLNVSACSTAGFVPGCCTDNLSTAGSCLLTRTHHGANVANIVHHSDRHSNSARCAPSKPRLGGRSADTTMHHDMVCCEHATAKEHTPSRVCQHRSTTAAVVGDQCAAFST